LQPKQVCCQAERGVGGDQVRQVLAAADVRDLAGVVQCPVRGLRLRIKEAQRLTLRSGEAVTAVAAWPVPADRRRPSRGEAGRDGAARARVTWVSQGGGSGSGITAGGSIALVPATEGS
jgi:hypothetical protein